MHRVAGDDYNRRMNFPSSQLGGRRQYYYQFITRFPFAGILVKQLFCFTPLLGTKRVAVASEATTSCIVSLPHSRFHLFFRSQQSAGHTSNTLKC
jgi:hypothetical protein